MKSIRYNPLAALLLFFISPIISIPLVLIGICSCKKSAFFLFSLFLGLIAFTSIPFADLFRHTLHYYSYEGLTISEVIQISDSDFLVPLITSFFINNHIPYEYFRLSQITIGFYLLCLIFRSMINSSPVAYSNKDIFYRFCILFLLFELLITISGVRFGFSVILFVCGVHLFIKEKKLSAASIFIIAALVHISMSFFIPLFLILFKVKPSLKKAIILFIFLSFFMPFIYDSFSFLLGKRLDWYFEDGINTTKGYKDATIIGLALTIGKYLFLIPIISSIFTYKNTNKWKYVTITWLTIACIFISNKSLFGRSLFVLQATICFTILAIERYGKFKQKKIQLFILCALFVTSFNTINMFKFYIIPSKYENLFFPIPYILQDTYEKTWILNHIDNNEYIKEVK